MKSVIPFMAAGVLIFAFPACNLFQLELPDTSPRVERTDYDTTALGPVPSDSDSTGTEFPADSSFADEPDIPGEPPVFDVYCSGVELKADLGIFGRPKKTKSPAALVLFRNGEPICRIDLKDAGTQASAVASGHFLAGGHLYTVVPGQGRSVFMKDSVVVSSFKDNCLLAGLEEFGGEVYYSVYGPGKKTLDICRGTERLYSFRASSPGPLHFDCGSWCCTSRETYMGKTQWNVVFGGCERSVSFNEDYEVFDVIQNGAQAVAVATDSDYGSYLLYESGARARFPARACHIVSAHFFPSSSPPALYGTMESDESSALYDFCFSDGVLESCPAGERCMAFCDEEGCVGWASVSYGQLLSVSYGGHLLTVPDCEIKSARCITARGGRVYAAFNDCSAEGRPVIWADGIRQEIPLDGYLTAVEVLPVKEEGISP